MLCTRALRTRRCDLLARNAAVGTRIEARQDGAPAVEVMPPRTHSTTRLSQNLAVKGRRPFDVRYRKNHTIKSSHGGPSGGG